MGGAFSQIFGISDPKDDEINNLKGQISNKNSKITELTGTLDRPLYNADNTQNISVTESDIQNNPSGVITTSVGSKSGIRSHAAVTSGAGLVLVDQLTNVNTIVGDLTAQNKVLASLPLNDYSISFIEVNTQNNLIDNQIKEIKDVYSTDNQKVNYQSDKISTLKYINYVLFLIYYVVFAFLIIVLLMYNITFTKQFKSLLVIIFILFPFVSDIVYQLIVYLYNFIYAMLNGNAYTSNNY